MLDEKFLMDYKRLTGKNGIGQEVGVKLLTTLGLRFMFWGRISENCRNPLMKLILKVIMHHYKEKYNLVLPFGRIGGGLALGYPHDIIVNGGVTMGEYVCLYKGVLIGSVRGGRRGGVPTIGSHVVIAQNATVVGNITIGNDVLIAAGAFVNFDVPDHSVVIGNPGVIHRKENATVEYK